MAIDLFRGSNRIQRSFFWWVLKVSVISWNFSSRGWVGLSSLLHSLLSSFNFCLGDICVSVICPQGISSQVMAIAVTPFPEWDISNCASPVIGGNFHNFAVSFVLESFLLEEIEFLLFEVIKAPSWANSHNIILFFLADVLAAIVRQNTSFVHFYLSRAETCDHWNLNFFQACMFMGSSILSLESFILERIVMACVFVIKSYCTGIRLCLRTILHLICKSSDHL